MKIWGFIIVMVLTLGCSKKHPLGKDYIYTAKDDHLSLQGKVDLLRASVAVKDDALLAAISILYAQNDNLIEAKESISKAIKINPLNPNYHLQLANYNAELQHNYAAYQEAKIAYELGAYDAKLEALIARMAIETSDSVKSRAFVTAYYNANQTSPDAQLLMARMHLLVQEYVAAKQFASKVLAVDSLNITGLEVMYAVFGQLENTALMLDFGNRLLVQDSTNAQLYFELATVYLQQSKTDKAAAYFAKSYRYQPMLPSLLLAITNYAKLMLYDSVLFYTDSSFARPHYLDKYVLLARAQAFDKRYKYDDSYLLYNRLVKMDSTDSVVNAERALVQRKITYLWRKKREQQQLADSLTSTMPIINF